jgi:hypothetical protein
MASYDDVSDAVDSAAQQMIAAGVEPAQAYATAQYMENVGYSPEDVKRGIGETAALFSARSAEEVRQATGYQGHIPEQQIDLGRLGQPVDVANFVKINERGQILSPTNPDLYELKSRETKKTEPPKPSSPFRGIYSSPSPASSTPATVSTAKLIKNPERGLSIFQEDITAQSLEKLLFENIGGIEIANIIRHDTVEGINPYYNIISNLSKIKNQIDPITLIARQKSSLTPASFGKSITLFTRIPLSDYLEDIGVNDYIFIDDDDNSQTYGNLIIELVNLDGDELVEVEIAKTGTIYQVEQ